MLAFDSHAEHKRIFVPGLEAHFKLVLFPAVYHLSEAQHVLLFEHLHLDDLPLVELEALSFAVLGLVGVGVDPPVVVHQVTAMAQGLVVVEFVLVLLDLQPMHKPD